MWFGGGDFYLELVLFTRLHCFSHVDDSAILQHSSLIGRRSRKARAREREFTIGRPDRLESAK